MFRDITTLIEDPAGFRESVDRLAGLHRDLGIASRADGPRLDRSEKPSGMVGGLQEDGIPWPIVLRQFMR